MFNQILKSKENFKVMFLSFILALFIGCGGGGGSSESADLQSAQFVDSPVAGLDYQTESLSGVTNDEGYFQYNSSDKTVTFSIGNFVIGEFNISNLQADKKVLPSDFFGLDRNDTTDERVIKVIQFLQSLDSDGNVSNGINIDNLTKNRLANLIETNNTLKTNLLENNRTVLESIINGVGKELVVGNIARKHYRETLQNLGIEPEFSPFVTVWQMKSDDKTITFHRDSNYEYNYTIDWGDGNISQDVNDTISHTYNETKQYVVKITGKFPHFVVNTTSRHNDDYQLIGIMQWGDIEWKSFANAFESQWSLLEVNASDVPDLSNVSDMSNSFHNNIQRINNIDKWDVSHVTDMHGMFEGSSFNQDIGDWNTSNVTNMSRMFCGNRHFNQDISTWDVSHVTDTNNMFNRATGFNKSINQWDLHNDINMSGMFAWSNFAQDIRDWNTSNVIDMSRMFYRDGAFNQDIGGWKTGNVTDMHDMFYYADEFNQNINSWDVSHVTNMHGMFHYAAAFNSPLDNWDVSNVTDMGSMFSHDTSFNQNIERWNTSNVENMNGMFSDAYAFRDHNLSGWNVNKVTDHTNFFSGIGDNGNIPPNFN